MEASKLHRTVMLGLLAALLGGGCLPCQYSACAIPNVVESCQSLPPAARGKVYVFLVNGYDPTNCANFRTLKNYLVDLGFLKTYYGQFFYTHWYTSEIRRIHECEPDAHFVLIGYSLGADAVRKVACSVAHDGINIDLLVYVDGVTVFNNEKAVPGNVQRVVNFYSDGCIFVGEELDVAENHHIGGVKHYGLPTHELTLATLGYELMQVAANVEFIMPVQPVMPMLDEGAPTPRPVAPRSMQPRDAWDYMKPVNSLSFRPEAVRYRPATETVVSTPLDNRQTSR
ncbi:MAG: hypothetical protein AB7K24_28685 [Gemmataceae bacterium]